MDGLLDACVGKMSFDVLADHERGLCAIGLEVRATTPMAEKLLRLCRSNSITILHVDVWFGLEQPLPSFLIARDLQMRADHVFPHCSRT
jgi:hypothetical protein